MVGRPRRSYLAALVAGTFGVAGCLGGSRAGSGPETDRSPTEPLPTEPVTTEPPSGPIRCEGEPVTAERTVTDEPGYVDDVRYFPGNETLRVVIGRSDDEPVSFSTWSFEKWATFECSEAGLGRARAVTADRLGTNEFGSGIGRPPRSAATSSEVVWLEVSTHVQDDDVVRTPAVSLARLVQTAPRSVEATVSLEGDTFSRTVPVFGRHVQTSFG